MINKMKTAEETLNDVYSHEEINDLKSKGLFYAMINQMNEFAKQFNKSISIYNLAHNEIDANCCGIFDRVDNEGMIICNECNVKMRDVVLENLKDISKPKIKDDVFGELCKPLMKYLVENYNPHTTVIITSTVSELMHGIKSTNYNNELINKIPKP